MQNKLIDVLVENAKDIGYIPYDITHDMIRFSFGPDAYYYEPRTGRTEIGRFRFLGEGFVAVRYNKDHGDCYGIFQE